MSKFEWTTDNLPTLGLMFLRTVRDKMRDGSTVRFGTTGKGIKPNYQVTFTKGSVVAFSGLSHDKSESADAFNDDNLSGAFDVDAIDTAYAGTKAPKYVC